jgi:tRNA dimethylallyltransferase
VENLIENGVPVETLVYYGLEYKFISQYLKGEYNYNEMVEKLNIAIHQFSKRQMTWFRKMEREGIEIHWIDGLLPINKKIEEAVSIIQSK